MSDEESPYGTPNRRKLVALGIMTLYLGGILLIVVSAPTLPIESFPASCPDDSRNCSRIAPEPYRATGEEALLINATGEEALAVVVSWIESQPRTVLRADGSEDGLVHAVFRSFVWRFPDDLLVQVDCIDNQSQVLIHSESRIGGDDFQVNDKRLLELADHLESTEWSGSTCE